MSRLIRLDRTGHTTLAEWSASDQEAYDRAAAAFAQELGRRDDRQRDEPRRDGRGRSRAAARRRPRGHASPDRRRLTLAGDELLSADEAAAAEIAALPEPGRLTETASVPWRQPARCALAAPARLGMDDLDGGDHGAVPRRRGAAGGARAAAVHRLALERCARDRDPGALRAARRALGGAARRGALRGGDGAGGSGADGARTARRPRGA